MAESLAGSIWKMSDALGNLQWDLHLRLDEKLIEVNNMAKSLGELNREISALESLGQEPNELYDKRDGLLKGLFLRLGFDSNVDDRG